MAGVLFMTGGLIFLCAAVENAARIPFALALLLIGSGLTAWSASRWRKERQRSPEVLTDRILDLAVAHDSEVTLAQVLSALDASEDVAREALARLEASGLCHLERRHATEVYAFPGLAEGKVVRQCTYCGNEYAVREPLHKCPSCGGTLAIAKT
jgi:rubrerythrin